MSSRHLTRALCAAASLALLIALPELCSQPARAAAPPSSGESGAVKGSPAPPAPTSGTSATSEVDPVLSSLERFGRSIERLTLDNGLRVVLAPDSSAKTVAVSVTYGVGSRDERPGQSGFAHLFEHMMFQGSDNVAKGQHFTLIAERGGTLNGTTSADRTNYFEVLPSSELALALWLEADRMRSLAVTPENFENQRAVVKEEYRMRIQNAPYMGGLLRLGELVFAGYRPYERPVIGTMEELDAAEFDWVKAFYEKHYAPNNAVLTIVGDFDRDESLRLARHYFGSIDKQASMRLQLPEAPAKVEAKKDVVRDVNAKTPGFYFGYLIPPSRTPEHHALEIAVAVLADGESSRLHQLLVRDRALAQRVDAWTRDYVGPDELGISVVLNEKSVLSQVQQLVEAELAKLAKTAPPAEELEKVKRRIRSSFVFGLQTNLNRAVRLGEYESYYGDARLLARELPNYLAVSGGAVQNAVLRYLGRERRQVVEVLPADSGPLKGAAK
jgi:predicted Zn-dependent peptidase